MNKFLQFQKNFFKNSVNRLLDFDFEKDFLKNIEQHFSICEEINLEKTFHS